MHMLVQLFIPRRFSKILRWINQHTMKMEVSFQVYRTVPKETFITNLFLESRLSAKHSTGTTSKSESDSLCPPPRPAFTLSSWNWQIGIWCTGMIYQEYSAPLSLSASSNLHYEPGTEMHKGRFSSRVASGSSQTSMNLRCKVHQLGNIFYLLRWYLQEIISMGALVISSTSCPS